MPLVRRATWQDSAYIAGVDVACGMSSNVALTPEEVEGLVDDVEAEFYVATLGGVIVGYLLACPDKKLKVTHLLRMAVAPVFRRRGVGSELWHSLKGRLRFTLPPQVQYRVYETDVETQLWLHHQGFLARGTEKHEDNRPDVYVFVWHAPGEEI